jgi:hypothetical protein
MRWRLAVLGAAIVGGVAAALLWSRLAEPAAWTVAERGLQMGQSAAGDEFGVPLAFAVIGLGGGLVLGFLIGVIARPVRWSLVVVAMAAAGVATLIAWQLGIVLGPPDPSGVTGLAVGDTVPDRLAVTVPAAFLAWPVATVAGLLPGVALNPYARAEARENAERYEQYLARWQAAQAGVTAPAVPSAGDGGDDGVGDRDQVVR